MTYPTNPAKREAAKRKRAAHYQANKERAAAQNAAWRIANADRKREMDKAYARANPDTNRRATAKYRKANPEKAAAMRVAWSAANVERIKEWSRQYFQENKERFAANAARWKAANPEKARSIWRRNAHNLRLQRELRRPLWWGELDDLVLREAFALAVRREIVTSGEWHVDHMFPLLAREVSGLHCALNIQVIPARLNRVKSNRLWLTEPFDWLRAEVQDVL